MAAPLLIALLGAESTGKTSLAEGVAARLAAQPMWRADQIGVVSESLRRFVELQGRTPRADEQLGIAREQSRRIADALTRHRLVLADTTAWMTAVYSEQYFQDRSLYEMAKRFHQRADLTLLTALDLPWEPDGLQRDGPQVREPVDALLRQSLSEAGFGWAVVHGTGHHRITRALRAMRPLLAARDLWPGDEVLQSGGDPAEDTDPLSTNRRVRWRAACECCEDSAFSWRLPTP